jgi:predicted Zn-dependent protease
MKVDGVRICPACGARNKAAWEYCARCAEPLAEVPLEGRGQAAPPARVDALPEAEGEPGTSPSWGIVVLAAIGVAAAWAALASRNAPEAARADAGFTFATLPPSPAAQAALPQDPGRAIYEEGLRLLARGQAAEAAERFAAAVQAAPDNPAYHDAWGQALIATGALDRGLGEMEVAARLSPSPDYSRSLARALNRAGRNADAIDAYRRAADADPGHVETLRELADVYLRANRPTEAVPVLRQAANERPNDLALAQQLGHALERSGDTESAAGVYGGILEKAPEAHVTRGRLAEVRIAQGRFDEAIGLFQDGLSRYGSAPLLHRGLASALERAGRDAEAAAAYREYARLAPGAADAQELAARAAALERRSNPAS